MTPSSTLALFFAKIFATAEGESTAGERLYQQQIQSRLVAGPPVSLLLRCQKIWGRDFLELLLHDYFLACPPQSYLWAEALQKLPDFILQHPDYSRIFALVDVVSVCLKLWNCLHASDPSQQSQASRSPDQPLQLVLSTHACFHFPLDSLDLHQLWNDSQEYLVNSDEEACKSWTRRTHQGVIFVKLSSDETVSLRLKEEELPLLESLMAGGSLLECLTRLGPPQLEALMPHLPETLELWYRWALLVEVRPL